MKKILLIVFLFAGSLTGFAQVSNDVPPVSFGIKAGVNFANLQQTYAGSSEAVSSGTLTSFQAGVFADFRFGGISIQPSLLYNGEGATSNINETVDGFPLSSNIKLTINYLQLPVYALYHIPVNHNDFYFGLGPFLSYGINGTEKGSVGIVIPSGANNATTENEPVNQKVKFGSDSTSDVKRIDYGATVMAGFKFSGGFLISAFYDMGLANIAANDYTGDDAKVKTRVLGISVGYSF